MPKVLNNQVKTSYKKIGKQHIYIYSFNLLTTSQQYTLLSFTKKVIDKKININTLNLKFKNSRNSNQSNTKKNYNKEMMRQLTNKELLKIKTKDECLNIKCPLILIVLDGVDKVGKTMVVKNLLEQLREKMN